MSPTVDRPIHLPEFYERLGVQYCMGQLEAPARDVVRLIIILGHADPGIVRRNELLENFSGVVSVGIKDAVVAV
jgi:hypothetical protein